MWDFIFLIFPQIQLNAFRLFDVAHCAAGEREWHWRLFEYIAHIASELPIMHSILSIERNK